MKLHQNAKELVLLDVDSLGIIIGEIKYNRQTETVLFALEKSAFFDIYFPCTVVFDQQNGLSVHPHIFSSLSKSSIRVQRSKVSCFVLQNDINESIIKQYYDLLFVKESLDIPNFLREDSLQPNSEKKEGEDDNDDDPHPTCSSKVIPFPKPKK